MAQGVTPDIEDVITPAINTALDTRKKLAEVKQIEALADKTQAETGMIGETVSKIHAEIANIDQDTSLKEKEGLIRDVMLDIHKLDKQSKSELLDKLKMELKIYKESPHLIRQEVESRINAAKSLTGKAAETGIQILQTIINNTEDLINGTPNPTIEWLSKKRPRFE